MPNSILVLGGYGNFGKRISRALAKKGCHVIVAGRSADKARSLAMEIGKNGTPLALNANHGLEAALRRHKPAVVVNTVGPFQGQGYGVAETCIQQGVHYVDLADGRDFVNGIVKLDAAAKQNNVAVISGASTVPALSDAVVTEFETEFSSIDLMRFGISPGQKAERGLATTKGILSYVGKPLEPFSSVEGRMFGWQNLYRQQYPGLGTRWMANCEIPDLDILPARHGIKNIQFSAGLELGFMHLGLWALGWLVRTGLPLKLERFARPLLAVSNWFNIFGSADGGMHVTLLGEGYDGKTKRLDWFVIAKDGHGPHIPTVPAILLAERLAKGELVPPGAYPCVGLLSLNDYLKELSEFKVSSTVAIDFRGSKGQSHSHSKAIRSIS